MTFGERLKQLRETAGLSQIRLANLIGTSSSYISDLERGRRNNPTLPILSKMAPALGVTTDQLMNLKDPDRTYTDEHYTSEDITRMVLAKGGTEGDAQLIIDYLDGIEKSSIAAKKMKAPDK